MKLFSLRISDVPITCKEKKFIEKIAFPTLDKTKNDKTLEKMADGFWNLCLFERQRTAAIDAKAAALTNISSLAAAVIAASSVIGTGALDSLAIIARVVSVLLFILTVFLSLNVQQVTGLGGFSDIDVFQAVRADTEPVGTPEFDDKDQYRCFLRETILQRWLVYSRNCNANDAKYHKLWFAQMTAGIAVGSLAVMLYKSLM